MFLDEQHFYSGPPPEQPRRTFRHEKAVSRLLLIVMLGLLVLPVSADGLAALVHYLLR